NYTQVPSDGAGLGFNARIQVHLDIGSNVVDAIGAPIEIGSPYARVEEAAGHVEATLNGSAFSGLRYATEHIFRGQADISGQRASSRSRRGVSNRTLPIHAVRKRGASKQCCAQH